MGSSDLNLKKSWHPSTFKNQERVWKEEQKHKEEERKLEQLKKELAEERQLQELQRMQEDAGSKQRSNKLDWMYASPNANLNGSSNNDSMEDFLLGKKNVDDLLRAKQKKEVEAATMAEESRFLLSNSNANNERDIQAKIREDPLLMIKKREQMALKAIMENPLKLKELKKKEKKDKKKSSKSSDSAHKHHHSSSRRSHSVDKHRHSSSRSSGSVHKHHHSSNSRSRRDRDEDRDRRDRDERRDRRDRDERRDRR